MHGQTHATYLYTRGEQGWLLLAGLLMKFPSLAGFQYLRGNMWVTCLTQGYLEWGHGK